MEMDPALIDRQCQLLNARTDNIGKHFSYFLQEFSIYARKVASVRDKGDNLVDIVRSYADTETNNPLSRQYLHEFAHWLAMVQDFRHHSALRITTHIIPKFQKYKDNVSNFKADIRKCHTLSEKSKNTLESLDKLRAKAGENSAVYLTSMEVYRRTSIETVQQAAQMRTHAKEFEELKLLDLQNILTDFIRSEMMFHCRAIEMYTAAYRSMQNISVDDDLKQFSDVLDSGGQPVVVPQSPPRMEVPLRSSVSQPNLAGGNVSSKAAQILGDSALMNAMNSGSRNERPKSAPRSRAVQRAVSLQESDTD